MSVSLAYVLNVYMFFTSFENSTTSGTPYLILMLGCSWVWWCMVRNKDFFFFFFSVSLVDQMVEAYPPNVVLLSGMKCESFCICTTYYGTRLHTSLSISSLNVCCCSVCANCNTCRTNCKYGPTWSVLLMLCLAGNREIVGLGIDVAFVAVFCCSLE